MEKWWQDGGKWGGMGENGGEWGRMGENGENGKLWEIAKNTLWEMYEKCVKLEGNGRKIGEKWDNLGQISHFSQSHFPFFPQPRHLSLKFLLLAELADWKMGIWGLADISRFFGQRRWLLPGPKLQTTQHHKPTQDLGLRIAQHYRMRTCASQSKQGWG